MKQARTICFSIVGAPPDERASDSATRLTSKGIINRQGINVPPETPRQSRADRRTFAVAVVVVIALPGPLRSNLEVKSAVRRLPLGLKRAGYLADIDLLEAAIYCTHSVSGFGLEAADGVESKSDEAEV